MTRPAPHRHPAGPGPAPDSGRPRQISSAELLGGTAQLAIAHGGAVYTLRLTRNGKLILTK